MNYSPRSVIGGEGVEIESILACIHRDNRTETMFGSELTTECLSSALGEDGHPQRFSGVGREVAQDS